MNPGKNIAIVGAGIGGLTAALALQQYGIATSVYESRPFQSFSASEAEHASGAGIWVPANAMQVFSRLGLAEKVLAAGYELSEIELLDYLSGSLMKVDLTGIKQKFDYAIVAIRRSRLHQILLEALQERRSQAEAQLHFGYRCQAATVSQGQVVLSFFEHEKVIADYVLGADGLHSSLRQSIFPVEQPIYSGQTSWRAVVKAQLPQSWKKTSVEIWGEGRRFGFSHVNADEVYWYATADMPASAHQDDSSSFQSAEIDALKNLFATFPAAVHELLAATTAVIRTDLSDLANLPKWYSGKIVLLGDAAHATTPNLGQGGAQAIEDGYLLAKTLHDCDEPIQAFEQYQKIRQEKARHIVSRSRLLGKMAHLKGVFQRQLRNAAVKYTPPAVNLREFEKLYSLNF